MLCWGDSCYIKGRWWDQAIEDISAAACHIEMLRNSFSKFSLGRDFLKH